MDYSPISARRVAGGFMLTALVAALPVLILLMSSDSVPVSATADAVARYRGLIIGAVSVVMATVVIGLLVKVVLDDRREVQEPSSA